MCAAFGLVHALLSQRATAFRDRLADRRGQGTVEYVGLILLVALMMLGVLAVLKGTKISQGKELGELIVRKITEAIETVQF